MNILVTGGTGFVGTNLIKGLLKDSKEHNIYSYDSYHIGKEENHLPGVTYLNQDLAEGYWYIEDKIDLVYHLAAYSRIQPSIKDPKPTIKNNFLSTLNLLETAADNNTPVIYSGSSSFHSGIYESPYAWSKHSGEQMCKLYSKHKQLKTMICRFYNVYGQHQVESGKWSTVIGIFEKQFRDNKPLTIVGTGEQRRDFTHIEDIVSGLISMKKLIIKLESTFKTPVFELGRGKNHSINEIADMFGKNYPRQYIPARKGEYDITLADLIAAETLLDYKPVKNIEDYVKNIVNT